MHDAAPSALPVPRLLEVHEVAFLMKCSQETVRRFIRRGKLPAILIGTHWRIDPVDYRTFIDAQRVLVTREERAIDQRFAAAKGA